MFLKYQESANSKNYYHIIWSCCGIDITTQFPENDICPKCHEHCRFSVIEFHICYDKKLEASRWWIEKTVRMKKLI